jgi:hypothetical protein
MAPANERSNRVREGTIVVPRAAKGLFRTLEERPSEWREGTRGERKPGERRFAGNGLDKKPAERTLSLPRALLTCR